MDFPKWAPKSLVAFLSHSTDDLLPEEAQAVLRALRKFIDPLVCRENAAIMRPFWGRFCKTAPGRELELCRELFALHRFIASGQCPSISERRKDVADTIEKLDAARKVLKRTDPEFRTASGTKLVNELGLAITKLKASADLFLPETIYPDRTGDTFNRIAFIRGTVQVLKAFLGSAYGPAMAHKVVSILLNDLSITITSIKRITRQAAKGYGGEFLRKIFESSDYAEILKDLP